MKKLIVKLCLITLISLSIPLNANAAVDPYIGQIMPVGFNFCPRGWALADGQTLQISQNSALFSLLGCTYGGDCRTTFSLPDLRGRSPVHVGTGAGLPNIAWGEKGGDTNFTLATANIPSHNHGYSITIKEGPGVTTNGSFLAQSGIYRENGTSKLVTGGTTNNTGGGQAVDHRSPFLGLYFCISLQGIFPSRT